VRGIAPPVQRRVRVGMSPEVHCSAAAEAIGLVAEMNSKRIIRGRLILGGTRNLGQVLPGSSGADKIKLWPR
jgi:hypothetical protein